MAVEHHYLKRTEVSDANLQTGRYAILGSEELNGLLIGIGLRTPTAIEPATPWRGGVFCRYTSTSNWLQLVAKTYASPGTKPLRSIGEWSLIKRKEGSETVLSSGTYTGPYKDYATLYLWAGADGNWRVYSGEPEGEPVAESSAPDVDLVLSGKLAKGKYGIYDAYTSAEAKERQYRGFQVIPAAVDPAMFASRTARLTTNGAFRQSSDEKGFAVIYRPGADLPRLPVSGPEERSVEVALKPSRGDFEELPDAGLDKIQAQATYRPCWSFVPSS